MCGHIKLRAAISRNQYRLDRVCVCGWLVFIFFQGWGCLCCWFELCVCVRVLVNVQFGAVLDAAFCASAFILGA